MSAHKWLFFDIGSTLIDEKEAYQDRIRRAITGTNINYDIFYARMVELFKEGKKGDLETIKEFNLERPIWNSNLEKVYPDAQVVLKELHNRYKIGIIANQLPGLKERLKKMGLYQWIDLVVSSAEFGLAKPSPAIFTLALEKAHCLAQQAVMIGDRIDNDIIPAKALGMTTIWLKQGFSAYYQPQRLEEKPDFTIENLSSLLSLL